jgi:uncharacterized protein (TIGR02594 family)
MRSVVAALFAVLIAALSVPAHAKSHRGYHHVSIHGLHIAHHQGAHRHVSRHTLGRTAMAPGPQEEAAGLSGLASVMARYLGTNPTGWAHNWCGVGLAMVARAAGLTPPAGYALALNWRHFGRPASGPAPGVVMVMGRGGGHGHVAVVTEVLGNGLVRTISANHGRRVAYGDYPISRAIAWRSPS